MEFTRDLYKGCEPGVDVFYMKGKLFELGMLEKEIATETKTIFDEEMETAVLNFQEREHGSEFPLLPMTGKITPYTWEEIEKETHFLLMNRYPKFDSSTVIPEDSDVGTAFCMPQNIHPNKAEAIVRDFGDLSAVRRKIIFEALKYATDPDFPRHYPLGLYIRGRSLYNKYDQETINIVTDEQIHIGEERMPIFFPSEKKRLMLETISLYPNTPGADSSGGIIGLCHFAKVCKPGTDVTPNTLATDRYSKLVYKVEGDEKGFCDWKPGDWACKQNHIGLYVGGGFVVEWIGGAYGCQLTNLFGDRFAYNFITNRVDRLSPWEQFRVPIWY